MGADIELFSGLAAEEKAAIRPRLLLMVDEPDRVVGSRICVFRRLQS